MKPRNPLLQKQALDETMVMWNDPEYAEHQHHSDPDFTTQNGKDYAGRNSTEVEGGALQDGIPADLLSVELGKSADKVPTEPDPETATFFKESEPSSPFSTAEEEINGIVNSRGFQYGARVDDGTTLWVRGKGERLSFNPKDGMVTYSKDGKAVMACPIDQLTVNLGRMAKSAARAFQAAIRPSPTKVFEDKVDQAIGKQPIAPTEPSDDEVMKAQKTLENAGVGDQIGVNAAGVPTKSINPTGDTLTHTDDYKNCAECGEQFQVDPRWGGDYCSACRRKMREGSAEESPQLEVLGTKMSGYAGGGPFTCMNCVHRTPHSKNAEGKEVDSCKHPKVMADPELADRLLPDGTIEVDYDDCCTYVRPPEKGEEKEAAVTKTYGTGTPPGGTPNDPSVDVEEEEGDKTASAKTAEIGIHETPRFLPPRDDIRRHLDTQVQDEVMEGVMDEDKTADAVEGEVVPRREGNFKLYAFPPDTPLGQYGEIKRPAPKHEVWYVGDRIKALPIVQENWGPITHEQENQLLDRGYLDLPDVKLRVTCVDYTKPTILPKKKLQASEENEYYLDKVRDMKDEAKQVFMVDETMLQEAQDAGMTMEDLWKEVGEDFIQNYYESAYSKWASIEVEEGFKCPNCKSTKGKAVKDGVDDDQGLRECLACRCFY